MIVLSGDWKDSKMKITKLSNNSDTALKVIIVLSLIAFAVGMRLLPHPPNFAPITAVAIFGGAFLPRRWALSLPLAAIVLSDLIIGLHPLILFTWGSFLLIALGSNKYMKQIRTSSVVGASVASSVLFFLVTNFGVWAEGRLYPLTLPGLGNSYVNAIPFFRNTLMGDLVFSAILFGSYVFVYRFVFSKKGSLKIQAATN